MSSSHNKRVLKSASNVSLKSSKQTPKESKSTAIAKYGQDYTDRIYKTPADNSTKNKRYSLQQVIPPVNLFAEKQVSSLQQRVLKLESSLRLVLQQRRSFETLIQQVKSQYRQAFSSLVSQINGKLSLLEQQIFYLRDANSSLQNQLHTFTKEITSDLIKFYQNVSQVCQQNKDIQEKLHSVSQVQQENKRGFNERINQLTAFVSSQANQQKIELSSNISMLKQQMEQRERERERERDCQETRYWIDQNGMIYDWEMRLVEDSTGKPLNFRV